MYPRLREVGVVLERFVLALDGEDVEVGDAGPDAE